MRSCFDVGLYNGSLCSRVKCTYTEVTLCSTLSSVNHFCFYTLSLFFFFFFFLHNAHPITSCTPA
ncbi:hypothetical protein GE21DRAFT_1039826 [Neurospora crassa]|nr:hypothetical protein GE21DRAFT_1039826 [Neurospora crassa]